MKRVHVYIFGKVQGVFFRVHASDMAEELGLTGWVRNISDGRVEAVFEGGEGAIDAMISWCHRGSPNSRVEGVEVEQEEYRGEFSGFGVRY